MSPLTPRGGAGPDHGSGEPGRGSPGLTGRPPPWPRLASPDEPPVLDERFGGGSLYALRSAVAAHVAAAGMPPGRAEDIVICVHELAANAIRHGAGAGRVRIWRIPGGLRCQVDDGGPARHGDGPGTGDDDDVQGGLADVGGRWPYEYGHGLWLVRYAADGLGVWSGPDGTRAVLTFLLPAPGPRPPFRLARRAVGGPPGRRRVLLTGTGDLDREAGADLLAAAADLFAGGSLDVILDLNGVAFSDVAGIAALSSLQHEIDRRPPASLTIVLSGALRRRLEQARLTGRLRIADSVDLAVGDEAGPAGPDGDHRPPPPGT